MSSAELNPIENPSAWHVVTIAGVDSPGLAQVGEFKRAFSFDVKKGKGSDGATITFTGRQPAKGSIKFILWLPEHFQAWSQYLPLFKYDATKKDVTPVDIYYPSLDDLNIKSVVCESIGNIQHEGKGLYTVVVELLEYLPPPKKSAVQTPDGSKSGNAGGAPSPGAKPDPIADAQQKEIARLLEEAKKP